MKVIGHRGAAGLALENTLESIHAAIKAGVDAIEFDVRLTSDGHFVLCHDNSISRVSEQSLVIHEVAITHIDEVILRNGEKLATLPAALKAVDTTPVFIETKGTMWAKPLADLLNTYDRKNMTVISFNHVELSRFAALCPDIRIFASERTKPFDTIQLARQSHFTGVVMNFWILNPLTYWMARRKNLEIMVYTVNHRWIAWYLNTLFPEAWLTTDHPHKMQFLRRKKTART